MLTFVIEVGACELGAESPKGTFRRYSETVQAKGMDAAMKLVASSMRRRGLRPVGRCVAEVAS